MTEILPNFIKNRAHLTPDREAIVYKEKRLTFKELYEMAYYRAGILTGLGVKDTDYVGFLVKSDLETVLHLYAMQIIGAKAVLLNNRLTAKEIAYQLKDAKVTYLITEELFQEKVIQVKEKVLEISIYLKEDIEEYTYIEPKEKDYITLDETCTIMYTSGTTGLPKGVIQSYGNHWWSAVGNTLNAGLYEKDTWLCTVPIFHISGYSILMKSIIYGMKIVLHESFDEKRVLQDLWKEKITIISVVTTMLQRIEQATSEKFPAYFRYMLLGGGPATVELLTRCINKGILVYYSYGMTETSSQIVTLSPEDSISKIGSAGKPLFPAQLRIVNPLGEELGPNEVGEITVCGPNVSKGYLNKENHLINGWFFTGDIGYIDSEGFLYVLDRRSDLIISGGENVYPAEVEAVLTEMEGIREAAVIGIPDAQWGQVPVAFVVEDGSAGSEKWIMENCEKSLAKYKIPKKIIFVSEIPRNASGKIVRRDLRKWVEEQKDFYLR
ncbi:o-succinylbenzoate--CoA ligase [Niallia sp. FSL W8-0635]|uniref:o-succinylbenzoate--CoA ligase n=1 Tax=Niallia sp. FSL W8-0635 TaxID=2975337 RepID=UPI0009D1FCFA|nr:fatty-acid-CoA ligase FadD13 [Mycobacteroides abscessus subsp. abscessus]HEO8420105.1 o-succinylbenzoate--CoA ligase [Yersinia enterocolitica]